MNVETPPQAWGRPWAAKDNERTVRNTPTGVGKTLWIWVQPRQARETPPQAWGRPGIFHHIPCNPGNTPTGVGKT